jgi:P-type Cu2+ transporter
MCLLLTIPVVTYSRMLGELTGWDPPGLPGDHWIPPILGTAVFAYGGPVFLTAGWGELRSRRPGMMLLISLGLLVAFGASAASTLGLIDADLWPELATLVTIMLLGHWLEMRALGQAQGAGRLGRPPPGRGGKDHRRWCRDRRAACPSRR